MFPNFIDPEDVLINIHSGDKRKKKKHLPDNWLLIPSVDNNPLQVVGYLSICLKQAYCRMSCFRKTLTAKIEENEVFLHCNLICKTLFSLDHFVHSLFFQELMERELKNGGELWKIVTKGLVVSEYCEFLVFTHSLFFSCMWFKETNKQTKPPRMFPDSINALKFWYRSKEMSNRSQIFQLWFVCFNFYYLALLCYFWN